MSGYEQEDGASATCQWDDGREEVRLLLRRVSDAGPFAMFGGTVGPASESLQRRNPRDTREGFTVYGDLRAGRVAPVMRRSAEQRMAEPRQRWERRRCVLRRAIS